VVQGLAKPITLKSPTKSPEADPPDTLEENIGAAALELTPADLAQIKTAANQPTHRYEPRGSIPTSHRHEWFTDAASNQPTHLYSFL